MIELILRQDINKLGKTGNVVKVKEGFARNYLIPNGLAYPATPENLKRIEEERQKRLKGLEDKLKAAKSQAEKLNGLSCTILAQAQSDDELYGGIGAADISQALEAEGVTIDKNDVLLNDPIKKLGIYEVEVKLHPEVAAKIKVWVVKR